MPWLQTTLWLWMCAEPKYLSSVLVFFVTFVSLDMTFSKHDQLRARYC